MPPVSGDNCELVEVKFIKLLVSVSDTKVLKDVLVECVIHEVSKEVFEVGNASCCHAVLDIVVEGQELLPGDHAHQAGDQRSKGRPELPDHGLEEGVEVESLEHGEPLLEHHGGSRR